MTAAAAKRRRWKWIAPALAIAGLGWMIGWPEKWRGNEPEISAPSAENRKAQHPSGPRHGRIEPAPDEVSRARSDAAERRAMEADWERLLEWLDSDPAPDAGEIRERLMELRTEWAAMDAQVLAEFLTALLESGVDFATGMDFEVGPHGMLAGWPSGRVFLLDVLAASDPEMAAACARSVLAVTGSAEEYATALRSLTRWGAGRAEEGELLGYFDRMLGRDDWRERRGLAEGLDLARWLGSPEAAMRLLRWDGHPALKEMALDEFAAEHPAAMMRLLAQAGEGVERLDGGSRARLVARADVTDPGQRAALDAYVRSPLLTPDEAATFFAVFPLRSATTGYRLYGKTPAPYSREGIVASDLAALDLAGRWAEDPALAVHRKEIMVLRGRLAEWVRQARKHAE